MSVDCMTVYVTKRRQARRQTASPFKKAGSAAADKILFTLFLQEYYFSATPHVKNRRRSFVVGESLYKNPHKFLSL